MTRVPVTPSVLVVTLTALGGCGRPAGSAPGRAGAERAGAAHADSTASAAAAAAVPFSGTLTGLYVDVAGGPLFTDCGTSRGWPVAAGGPARALEEAYLTLHATPGDAVRVTVRAHSIPHAGVGGAGEELVIDKVLAISGESACPGQHPDAPLAGTLWRALSLKDRPVNPATGAVTLRLDAEAKTLQASTACRSLNGTFRWVGTQLTFDVLDAVERRCPATASADAMALDATILDVLRTTGSYRIRGDTLDLMGANGVLARFVVAG
ncbi:MAG: META domain-containing protein [Gemmatimonadetes bacterium]|nr:META domain-containing protein [Gemmatimonadota bacterium]